MGELEKQATEGSSETFSAAQERKSKRSEGQWDWGQAVGMGLR